MVCAHTVDPQEEYGTEANYKQKIKRTETNYKQKIKRTLNYLSSLERWTNESALSEVNIVRYEPNTGLNTDSTTQLKMTAHTNQLTQPVTPPATQAEQAEQAERTFERKMTVLTNQLTQAEQAERTFERKMTAHTRPTGRYSRKVETEFTQALGKPNRLAGLAKLNRLIITRRNLARRPREPRRAIVTYSSTKTHNLRRMKNEGNYTPNYYNVVISTRGASAVIMYMQFSLPPNPPGLFKPDRIQAKKLRETRRTLQTTSITETTNFFNLTSEGNYLHNYFHVEISTRDVFAVITAINIKLLLCFPNMTRLYKVRRSTTGRSREPKRMKKISGSTRAIYLGRPMIESNYAHNHRNVEISKCDVLAVITPINTMLSQSFPNSARSLRQDRNTYRQSKRSGESKRTIKTTNTITTKKFFSILYQ